MKYALKSKDKKLLEYFAHYVWWEKKDLLITTNPLRIVANAMMYANEAKDYARLYKFGKNILKRTLKVAQAGWFDSKNWHFWHYMLYGENAEIPPLPKRRFLCN